MPINGLVQRLAQVGVIRLGELKINPKTNKPFPAKLTNFRITTPSERIANDIAGLFGGTPRAWRNENKPEWEVYTEASEMRVLVPPQNVDPNMEMWGPGMRIRLCDGGTERMRGVPCMCQKEFGVDFSKTAPKLKICKATFRVSLMIHDLQSAGSFKLESHGWNAAAEIPGLVNALSRARRSLPGTLSIVQKSKSILHPNKSKDEQVENRNWIEPRLDIDFLTSGQMYSAELETIAREQLGAAPAASIEQAKPAEQQPQLPAAPARPAATTTAAPAARARTAAPVATEEDADPTTTEGWLAAIAAADTLTNVNRLRIRFGRAKVTDDAVLAAWKARSAELGDTSAVAAKKPQPQAVTVGDDDIIDAELVEITMTGAEAWQAALKFAHTKGWNVPALSQRFTAKYGVDYRDDTKTSDAMFVEFLTLLKSGEIA